MSTPETTLTNQLIELLQYKGYTVKKIYNGGVPALVRNGRIVYKKKSEEYRGIPDLLAYNVKTKHFMFIEVKTPNRKLKPEQLEFQGSFNTCKTFESVVFRSHEDVIKHINELKKK